jgi:NAD(P)-dependent dehydrogenase (short-subunit alcohol dehydrogenase family)
MNIQNKTFIVTGGASGLGLATAQMIIGNGGNAVLLDINAVAGQEAETKLGANSRFVQTRRE